VLRSRKRAAHALPRLVRTAQAARSFRMAGKRAFPLSEVYGLIEPGPVVLLATADEGRPNVMPMSWHTMIEFEPPLIGCVVSDRNHSFAALNATGQCTINIPTAELAEQVVQCGNCSGREVDKFRTIGLTPRAGREVAVPTVAECYASLECRVIDPVLVNRYGMFILQVLRATVDRGVAQPRTLHHRGWGQFAVAGQTIQLASAKK
jgi:flavin reductase (DIM6/NTAB) family NADH-FMN oxidoreductase RutF